MTNDYRFAWDTAKSNQNLEKHGIDFDEGTRLWDDPWRTSASVPRGGERRRKLYARYVGAIWIAIYVQRDTIIRIISVRRATGKEVSQYDRAYHERSGI